MTAPDHKNQVGQDGAGVNGGEFAKKTQTADTVALAPQPERLSPWLKTSAQTTLDQIAELTAVMAAGADRLHAYLAADAVLDIWPTAAKAYVSRPWDADDDGFMLDRVVDGDGTVLFDGGYTDQARPVNDHIGAMTAPRNALVYEAGDANIAAKEPYGEMFVLNLTDTLSDRETMFSNAAGVAFWGYGTQYEVLVAVAETTGQVLIPASKAEFEYRLDDYPEELGFTEETGRVLDAKFGGRENTLQALIDTSAFLAFDEDASEIISERKNDAVKAAIEEALAS